MDIILDKEVEKRAVETRFLQWIVSDDGAIQSDKCACCIVEMMPGSTAKPPHSHAKEEEAIYVLEGNGEIITEGGVSHPVEKGSFILMRCNEIHMLCNNGNVALKAICFYSDNTDVSKYTFYPMEVVEENGADHEE